MRIRKLNGIFYWDKDAIKALEHVTRSVTQECGHDSASYPAVLDNVISVHEAAVRNHTPTFRNSGLRCRF